jgi:hypothetical protein
MRAIFQVTHSSKTMRSAGTADSGWYGESEVGRGITPMSVLNCEPSTEKASSLTIPSNSRTCPGMEVPDDDFAFTCIGEQLAVG